MRKTILDLSDAREIFDQVLAHWATCNQQIAPREVVLKGGFTRNDFLNLAVEFDHLTETVDSKVEYRDRTSEQLNRYKENMRSTMQRFSFIARGLANDHQLIEFLPALPDSRSSEEKYMKPVEDLAEVWARLNQEGPVALADGTTLEAFSVGIQVLRQAFRNRERAFDQERYARAIRRQHHEQLIERCVQYRSMILGIFGEESEYGKSLPYLWAKQNRTRTRRQNLKVIETEAVESSLVS